MRSDDLPKITARDLDHAEELNRRIKDWQAKLRRVYPGESDVEILRLACAYVADEDAHPEVHK